MHFQLSNLNLVKANTYRYPEARRNHVGIVCENRYMIIHGGLDIEDQVFNDAWIYQPRKCFALSISF